MPMTNEQLRAQIQAGPQTQEALNQAYSTYSPEQLAAAFPEHGGVEQYRTAAALAQANTTPNAGPNTTPAAAPVDTEFVSSDFMQRLQRYNTQAAAEAAAAPVDNWMPNQWYNPNVMPENFDWQRYIGANQDLGAAGIDTQEEAMRHYDRYGRVENRSIGALTPTRFDDLSQEDRMAAIQAYGKDTGKDTGKDYLLGVGPWGDDYDPVREWAEKNYIPKNQFKTDYAAAKPADKFDLLDNLQTSNRPPEQLANIRKAWDENKDKPSEMRRLMQEYGVTLGDLSQATGETYSQLNSWVEGGDILGVVGFSVNKPGAYDKYKKQTTQKLDPNSQFVTGASTPESRLASYEASQQRAKHTFDPVAYAKDPEAYVKKMREQGGLAALVAEKAVPSSTGTQASIPTSYQQPEKITAANFQSEYDKLRADSNVNEDQQRKFLTSALEDPTIKAKLGSQLQPALDELNKPPGERMLGQIEKQRGALGGQYYQGVYSDPKTMAKILEDKGVKSLADLGQKEKFKTATAAVQYTTADGKKLTEFNDGTLGFAVESGEGSEWRMVPKDQAKASYGKYEDDGYGETKFTPLSEKEQATLKDGKYQENTGNVVINKRTGEELTDTTRQLAYQSSSGGAKKKKNYLTVEFAKDGTPVLVATKEKAGLGAALQDIAPFAAMVLPFVLPGIGSAISSGLAGVGGSALATGSLANAALTQGLISGGLGSLTGQNFGKSFLSGAISPVISSGIGSLMPNMGLDAASGAGKAITGAGTGVVKGLLQGGDLKDLLGEGILSGLTNYGLGEATKSMNLTPQQLGLASGIVGPLLQGKKIDPMKLISSTITSGARTAKTKEEPAPGNAGGGLLEGIAPVKLQGNYNMDPSMFTGIAGNLMARSR